MWNKQVDEILSGLTQQEREAQLKDLFWTRKKEFRAMRALEPISKSMAAQRRERALVCGRRIDRLKRLT